MSAPRLIRVGRGAGGSRAAAQGALAQLGSDSLAFILAFVPSAMRPEHVAEALRAAPAPVFGCTTAGQIGPDGYDEDSLLLLGFPTAHFRAASTLIQPLRPASIAGAAEAAREADGAFAPREGWRRLALLIADGLSMQEDLLTAGVEAGLGEAPVFGGSAGDGLRFGRTLVLEGGVCRENAALLLLVETDLAFAGLAFNHIQPTGKRMVVTAATPEARRVTEINGSRATAEYARLIGCAETDLSPDVFAAHPVLVRHRDAYHVRAIHRAEPDGTLRFLSAIDDGLMLTLGRGDAILQTLEDRLGLHDAGGAAPDFILGFDCILRKLEIAQKGLTPHASEVLSRHNVLGFCTYGEQHRGVHVNQTFVGVAFFAP